MIKEDLYNKTVDILYKAYMNNTLSHGICTACAVGNIIAANLGYQVVHVEAEVFSTESGPVVYERNSWEKPNGETVGPMDPSWWLHYDPYCGDVIINDKWNEGLKQVLATGYSFCELGYIEKSFENADKGDSPEDWMFNGLSAVIDALDYIHENKDATVTVATKRKFALATS